VVSKVHFSTGKDNWGTPPWLFHRCSRIWDFRLDACAEKWSAKCDQWYGVKKDGLKNPWRKWTWCNPPYSNIEAWLEKASKERMRGASSVILMPSRTDTRAWHRYAPQASRVFFIKGRLKFIDPNGLCERTSAPFPSLLLEFDSEKKTGRKPSIKAEFISWEQ